MSQSNISKERLKALPTSPGVYLMKDKLGEVLYVGKAKNLRSRVRSYFNSGGDGRYKIQFLVALVSDIETLVTEDERQALILEADLIKKYKPKYNVRLKDDKAYLIVRIDANHEWPRLELVRKIKEDGARYLGPFGFAHELRAMLDVINKTIPLRTCSDRVIYNRVRPCLEYQMKRCAGPCCVEVDKADYLSWIEQAISILQGKNKEVVKDLEFSMQQASEQMRYEDAAAIRDRIGVLKTVIKEQPKVEFSIGAVDAFGIYREEDKLELSVLMVRKGRLFESKTFGFEDVELPEEELISSLLTQFYQGDTEFPDEIVLPCELEDSELREEIYSEKKGYKVKLVSPKKGRKAQLLDLAKANAKENFNARFSVQANIASELQEEFSLEQVPRIIECVDVSHFQGASTVASVVCFKDGRPYKQRYRHFVLSQEGKPDDFASMNEVLKRHLSRLVQENTPFADLIVIDGGRGQLSEACNARKEIGLREPTFIALAKKRSSQRKFERVYLEGAKEPIILKMASPILHLMERLRDEAHRFAISHHRTRRSKKMFTSELEKIPGIGPKRRKELLKEFGSVQAIRDASVEEISNRVNIPKQLAVKILDVLNA